MDIHIVGSIHNVMDGLPAVESLFFHIMKNRPVHHAMLIQRIFFGSGTGIVLMAGHKNRIVRIDHMPQRKKVIQKVLSHAAEGIWKIVRISSLICTQSLIQKDPSDHLVGRKRAGILHGNPTDREITAISINISGTDSRNKSHV